MGVGLGFRVLRAQGLRCRVWGLGFFVDVFRGGFAD